MFCGVAQQLQLEPHILGGFASLATASLLINSLYFTELILSSSYCNIEVEMITAAE